MADSFQYYDIRGKNGITIKEAFKNGPEAYYGTSVHEFPNMFLMLGPNTGLGHNSMIYMIESQTNFIIDAIQKIIHQNIKSIDVKKDVQDDFNKEIQKKLVGTIWQSGCKSWYVSESGKNHTVWPGFTLEFRNRTKNINLSKYNIEKINTDAEKMEFA